MFSFEETGIMRHLVRFILLVFLGALFLGCASTNYGKGITHYTPDDAVAAVRELMPLAEQGHAEAQFNLGSLYYQGRGVPQDYREALQWIYKAAEQGHVLAQTTLGSLYAEGVRGVIEIDRSQALMWFSFAAPQGDMEAREVMDILANRMAPSQIAQAQRLAREFKPRNVYTKALEEFKAQGERGDAVAQFKAGLIYYKGQGIPRDYPEALNWFRKAARQGYLPAQYNAGYMYEKGEGAPQDYEKAKDYYLQAAKQGNRQAQYNLGNLYEKGQGVERNEVEALMWYNLAASQEEPQARAARDRITVWMTPAQVAEAQRRAREFKIVGK
jgi:hypothetical protein